MAWQTRVIICILWLSEMPVNHPSFYRLHRHEEPKGARRVSFTNARAGLENAGQQGASSSLPAEVKETSTQRKANLTTHSAAGFCNQSSWTRENRDLAGPASSRPQFVCFPQSLETQSNSPLYPRYWSAKAAGDRRGQEIRMAPDSWFFKKTKGTLMVRSLIIIGSHGEKQVNGWMDGWRQQTKVFIPIAPNSHSPPPHNGAKIPHFFTDRGTVFLNTFSHLIPKTTCEVHTINVLGVKWHKWARTVRWSLLGSKTSRRQSMAWNVC